MGAQLSLKAALPLAERIATASDRCASTQSSRWSGGFSTQMASKTILLCLLNASTLEMFKQYTQQGQTMCPVSTHKEKSGDRLFILRLCNAFYELFVLIEIFWDLLCFDADLSCRCSPYLPVDFTGINTIRRLPSASESTRKNLHPHEELSTAKNQ